MRFKVVGYDEAHDCEAKIEDAIFGLLCQHCEHSAMGQGDCAGDGECKLDDQMTTIMVAVCNLLDIQT